MKRILVTGATGNIGLEVVHYLGELNSDFEILAAVRNVDRAKKKFMDYPDLLFREFDFNNKNSYSEAFNGVDILFLLRPPQISDVEKIFRPLLISAQENRINKIVFLSVQGAEKSKIIPHNKIERLIQELQFNYIFVRPSYFMQNLTTTLLPEIISNQTITLPSGKAKFNWIDVKNIGEVSAKLISDFDKNKNQSIEITGNENLNFEEVTNLMTEVIGKKITYLNLNPICFYFKKRKEGLNNGFAIILTILHFLPRLHKEPKITNSYQLLTSKSPTTLKEFLKREKKKLTIA